MSTGVTILPEDENPSVLGPRSCGYRVRALPPVLHQDRLALEIGLMPNRLREEAVQVAWLAHLQGECAVKSVKRWRMQELRCRRFHGT